jgi:hypothetical protein
MFGVQGSSSGIWSLNLGYWFSLAHSAKRMALKNLKTNIVLYFLTLCAMRHALWLWLADC